MTSKEALKCIIYRLTAQEDDLELRETAKVEIEIIKKDLDRLEKLEEFIQFLKRETNIHFLVVEHNSEDVEILMINGNGIVLDSKETELIKNVLYGG